MGGKRERNDQKKNFIKGQKGEEVREELHASLSIFEA